MRQWIQKDFLLILAVLVAGISAIWVKPSIEYMSYIDFRTIILLYCLMVIMSGFQKTGLFNTLMTKILSTADSLRGLVSVLVGACFFSAMLMTNDVALLTFVPLAIGSLGSIQQSPYILITIILQTVAANLGSMLTPIGNPQNLFLFGLSQWSVLYFVQLMLPATVFSAFLLFFAVHRIPKSKLIMSHSIDSQVDKKGIIVYLGLFVLTLAAVVHWVEPVIVLLLLVLILAFYDNKNLFGADFGLLLTFLALFVLVGNLGRINQVHTLLAKVVGGREKIVAILLSQIISNVPAAILLSTYTTSFEVLTLGVNLGGLGTLIASMASIISFKQYSKTKNAQPWRYLLVFTVVNIVFLAVLYVLT